MGVWIGSPNFTAGRGGNKVEGIIIHWMVGTLASTDSVFQNRSRNTSAHYGVEGDNLHQYVAEENTAYHAGNWGVNQRTIGIEHSAGPGRSASDATYETSARLIAELSQRHGFAINERTIRPHRAIVATQCSGDINNGGIDIARLIARANGLAGNVIPPLPAPAPAPAPIAPVVRGKATVVVDLVNVRTQPNSKAPRGGSGQLKRGDWFEFVDAVKGEMVYGVSTWLKSTKGNYVWAGATDYKNTPPVMQKPAGGVAEAVRIANVRSAPSTKAALSGSRLLQPGQRFSFSALVRGERVSQNGVTSDLWYHSRVGNYVWSGNCKEV